jgi:hypothetical protein
MRRHNSLVIIISLGLLSNAGAALAQNQDAAPQNPARAPHRQQGFLDYTLAKINPGNRDIGAELQADRTAIVEQSINNLYFWSNVFTLSLLVAATALLFLERRAAWKKELMAATLLTELWNGRISDRTEIERRTNEYNQLVDLHNAEVERGLISRSEATAPTERAESKTQRNVNKLAERPAPISEAGRNLTTTDAATTVPPLPPVEVGPTSLQQKVLLQQGQIEAMRNTEQNLKERLNQTTALLEQERKRNQSSKRA